ncbi:MAG: DUF1343 domain-containing protein [Bacillota bacterium]|nr:DUF1343 domain-containing protein [Bacillota bacterium]
MKKILALIVLVALVMTQLSIAHCMENPKIKLGNEVLLSKYHHLIKGKKIGLVTNQSGVDSQGRSIIDILADDKTIQLTALYSPEHGIDGIVQAGKGVDSFVHAKLGIPVHSLYGPTRMPTEEMLSNVDLLLFDMQDIGARTYTYMSTLNYCMVAAQKYQKPIIVLDRPNPLGGVIVEGPVLETYYQTFVGVDNLPMAHGMTAGELAQFFNRNIGAALTVVPMEGYKRRMIFQDTGLKWVKTSPNIPDIDSLFGYMATGLGEGTGIGQADQFKWIGGKGLDSKKYADLLNGAGLAGVNFIPETRADRGGVRLNIFDYHAFNPARTGIYALTYAFSLGNFTVPKSGSTKQTMVMFDKVMGTNKIGLYLEQGLTPQQIEKNYTPALNRFKEERKKYLIPDYDVRPGDIAVLVDSIEVSFDSAPFIDQNNRLMVPLRAIAEALGAQVQWNSAARSITISRQGKTIFLKVDSKEALVNGETKLMDTTPVIKNSRTMVPVRYVGEFLDSKVNWNPHTQVVSIY